MPYIKQEDRQKFKEILKSVSEVDSWTPGDLNYLLSCICHNYVDRKGKNYTHLNDVIGVLTGAQLEFYRKIVAPYEDEKILANGDI